MSKNSTIVTNSQDTRNGFEAQSLEEKLSLLKHKPSQSTLLGCLKMAVYLVFSVVSTVILIAFLVLLLPLVAVSVTLKFIEGMIIYKTSHSFALTGEDAMWQDHSQLNPSVIEGMISLQGHVTPDDVREVMMERGVFRKNSDGSLKYPRFTHFICKGYFQYFWVNEQDFNLDDHIHSWGGDVPSSKTELAEVLSALINKPLPERKSPWQITIIPTSYGERDSILLVRMSHSMADGVSLTRFLVRELPDEDTVEKEPIKFTMQQSLLYVVKTWLNGPAMLVKKLFSPADVSILHGAQLSGTRRISWTESIDLNLIKSIKNKTGTTVNDVLMTCMLMALRDYYVSKNADIPERFTASVPVDIRGGGDGEGFRNRFAVVFPVLPTGQKDPISQLIAMKRNMDVIKASGEHILVGFVMDYSYSLLPEWLASALFSGVVAKASGVLSNVPGPQSALEIKGHKVKVLTFWPPRRENLGLSLSMYSYCGKVFVGVLGDVAVLPDPSRISEQFQDKVNELARAVKAL